MRPLSCLIILLCLGVGGCSRLIADRFLRPPEFPQRDRQLLAEAERARRRWGDHLRTIDFIGADGTPLDADVLIPMSPYRGVVVLLHGIGDRKEGMLEFAQMLTRSGYLCIFPDLRAHGQSGGRYITFGHLERWDCVAMLNAVASTNFSPALPGPVNVMRVGVIGGSLGGSIALQWAGVDPRVRTVIALAPFATLRAEADHLFASTHPPFSQEKIARIERAVEEEGGFGIDAVSALRPVERRYFPVYLVRGDRDEAIPPGESDRLFKAARGPVALQRVADAGHEDLMGKLDGAFMQRAIDWMDCFAAFDAKASLPTWIDTLPHRNFSAFFPAWR